MLPRTRMVIQMVKEMDEVLDGFSGALGEAGKPRLGKLSYGNK